MVDMAYVIRSYPCPRGCRSVFARRLLSRFQWEDERQRLFVSLTRKAIKLIDCLKCLP